MPETLPETPEVSLAADCLAITHATGRILERVLPLLTPLQREKLSVLVNAGGTLGCESTADASGAATVSIVLILAGARIPLASIPDGSAAKISFH